MSVLLKDNEWGIYNTIPNYIYYYGLIIKILSSINLFILIKINNIFFLKFNKIKYYFPTTQKQQIT